MSILSEIASEECELELTPMIDVTFLLLLFFIMTLKFKTLEGKLSAYLPKDSGGLGVADQIERVDITIVLVDPGEKRSPDDAAEPWRGEGRFEYVGRRLAYRVGPTRIEGLDELELRLASLGADLGSEWPVLIRAQAGVTYGDVVPVLDRVMAAGFVAITFDPGGR